MRTNVKGSSTIIAGTKLEIKSQRDRKMFACECAREREEILRVKERERIKEKE